MIELTAPGEAAFTRLAASARAFDEQLHADLEPADITTLRALLDQLCCNVGSSPVGPPWAEHIEATPSRTQRKSTRTPTGDTGPKR